MTDAPVTHSGSMLDEYCNEVCGTLQGILDEIGRPGRESNDFEIEIPSPAQRKKFEAMVTLIGWAESFAGTLRYDVGTTHEECEYHDKWALDSIERLKETIAAL